MKKKLIIDIDIVNCPITICYGHHKYNKELSKFLGNNNHDTKELGGLTTHIDNPETDSHSIFIKLPYFNKCIYGYKALAVHELSHAVSLIMKIYGFKCDEFRSYVLQHVYSQVMIFIDNIIQEEKK